VTDSTLRELIRVPLLSVPYLALPLFVALRLDRWTPKDLGLTWKTCSSPVAGPPPRRGCVLADGSRAGYTAVRADNELQRHAPGLLPATSVGEFV
jgi:hypothetical protein